MLTLVPVRIAVEVSRDGDQPDLPRSADRGRFAVTFLFTYGIGCLSPGVQFGCGGCEAKPSVPAARKYPQISES